MATFNGVDLGLVLDWQTTAAPVERQINSYPRVNGLEILNLGDRGGKTVVHALLTATDVYALAALRQTFLNLQLDGGAYSFVDPDSNVWTLVILEMFRPGRRMLLAGGGVCQEYELDLLHTGD